ncbi:MAG: hypothetical protein V7603_5168 [Micromonosporaceae bacterium]
MAKLNQQQTLALAGHNPASFIEAAADQMFPRTPAGDPAAWRNKVRRHLREVARRVRSQRLNPEQAAELIDREFRGAVSSTTYRTSSIAVTLRAAPEHPDPQLVRQARQIVADAEAAATCPPAAALAAPTEQPQPRVPAPGSPAAAPGEVTGLVSAQQYAAAMSEAMASQTQTTEQFVASLNTAGVNGEAVAAAQRAQELSTQASAAWTAAAAALHRQDMVRQAYALAPDAGGKRFVAQ